MKAVSTALQSYLASISQQTGPNTIYVADLFTIVLSGGQTIYLCSGPQNITYGGNTFLSLEPGITISRSQIKQSVGLTVDTLKLMLSALPSAQPISGIPLLQEICQGYWDNATVIVDRLFGRYWGDTTLGTIRWWKGIVGEISKLDRSHVTIEVPSKLELLNQPLPKNVYQSTCRHVLFDAGCTLNPASYTFSGSTQTGSTSSAIITNLSQSANFAGPGVGAVLSTYNPSPGPNLPERVLFVVQTYTSALGESLVGPEVTSSFGTVTNVVITNPGSGYTPNASLTLSFTPTAGGSGAAGHVTVDINGSLAVVVMTAGGTGYNAAPNVTVVGGGGSNGALSASIAGIPGDSLLVVDSPPSVPGVTGWNCYIGYASGAEYLQTATPLAIGTNFLEPFTGIVQGNTPPITATNGYFSQGVIKFTSGVLNGLSRLVQTYTNNGSANVCNVIPPFPQAPSTGDTFTITPGCDRRLSTCFAKFNNIQHFGGFPFIPVPESMV